METLTEHADQAGQVLALEEGLIRGVKILGLHSSNGREYPMGTIAKAKALYEGAKVNVNHPAKPGDSRTYEGRLGKVCAVQAKDDGLYADFRYNPKHALAEQIQWDATHAPENLGFSHVIQAKTSRRGDTVVVEEITRVQSVDLVADPATTRGLFEATTTGNEEKIPMADDTLTMAQLRENYPGLVTKLAEEVLGEHAAGEEQTALQEELISLRSKVEGFEEAQALAANKVAIVAELAEAKVVATDVFVEALLGLDADQRAALIEDRKASAPKAAPKSRDQHADITESGGNASLTTEEYGKRWTSAS